LDEVNSSNEHNRDISGTYSSTTIEPMDAHHYVIIVFFLSGIAATNAKFGTHQVVAIEEGFAVDKGTATVEEFAVENALVPWE